MRTLHLACLPFPSPQGTQALLRAMLDALAAAGHETHLLTYAAGAHAEGAAAAPTDWTHHRLSDWPPVRSLRSGPSPGKVALDLRMVTALRERARALRPDVVVAHNVEAALVGRTLRGVPRVYVAHTRFDAELGTYFAHPRPWSRIGDALDRAACGLDATVAITPDLAQHLRRYTRAAFVMPPWPVADPPTAAERAVRPWKGPVLLYAGNLDAYQGLDVLLEASRGLRLLVATSSDPRPLRRHPHVAVWPLQTEADRRRAHAACDLVVVPRRAPGGLPIKLLDALARDVPVVAQRRALAGLRPQGVRAVADDDPAALRAVIEQSLRCPPRGGRRWLADACAPAGFAKRFVSTLRALLPVR